MGRSWPVLARLGTHLGSILADLGPVLRRSWPILGRSWADLGRSRPQTSPKMAPGRPHYRPRSAQDVPQVGPRRAKIGQDRPRSAQDRRRCPKMAAKFAKSSQPLHPHAMSRARSHFHGTPDETDAPYVFLFFNTCFHDPSFSASRFFARQVWAETYLYHIICFRLRKRQVDSEDGRLIQNG